MSDNVNGTRPLSEFDRLGFRVPFFAISPFAKRGHISHEVHSHASVLRFIEALFDLPALSDRTANATPPYDVFDFVSPPNLVPPALPVAAVDQAKLTDCATRYPDGGGL